MEFSQITHIDSGQLLNFEADFFLTTLGFESRCTHVARRLEGFSCRKIALVRTDHVKEFSFQQNLSYYEEQNYHIVQVESMRPDFDSLFGNFQQEKIRIILDCTSMSPRWYYEFFAWFTEKQDCFQEAAIRIVYQMGDIPDQELSRKVKSVKAYMGSGLNGNGKKQTG